MNNMCVFFMHFLVKATGFLPEILSICCSYKKFLLETMALIVLNTNEIMIDLGK